MDMKNLLSKISELQQLNESAVSEATKKTATGRVHTAEPGGYGRKVDVNDEDDDKKGEKKAKKAEPEVKRGRGRPKKNADSETGQVAKYSNAKSLQDFMVGNIPKGKSSDKKGTKYVDGKPVKSKAKKATTLKDWIEEINDRVLAEAAPVPVPVIDPATKKPVLGTITTTSSAPADQKMAAAMAEFLKGNKAQIVMPKATTPTNPTSSTGQTGNQPELTEIDEVPGKKVKKMKRKSIREIGDPSDSTLSPLSLEEGRDSCRAAYHEGKSHAMEGGSYKCRYDEGSDEHRHYHHGFKEGLDECWGGSMMDEGMPGPGVVGLAVRGADVMDRSLNAGGGLMDEEELDEVGRGEWIKQQDRAAERAGKRSFSAFGQKFSTDEVHESISKWDEQLNSLLNEGMTITTSTGQQGTPDSVSISASGEDAGELLKMLQNSGISASGTMPKLGQMSPMTHTRGDLDNGQPNAAAVSVRTMPAGSGMSVVSDYKEEEPLEPYDSDTIIDALTSGSESSDDRDSIGALRSRLLALEAADLAHNIGSNKRSKTLAMPDGKGFSENVEEEGGDAVEAVESDEVEEALNKAAPKQVKSTDKKSIYKEAAGEALGADKETKIKDPNPGTQTMRMPAGKGFSASPTESPEEIAEPTTQEEVNSALAKDAKRESDADREFAELKRMLGSQNMVDAKKKSTVKEAKDDDTSADSGMIQLSMPVGKGMSTQPTEDGREAPKAAPVVDVLDAIAKDSDGEEDHESEFQALKKLIAAHIKMPSGDNVGKGAPNEPTAPTDKSAGDNEFENSDDRASEKQSAVNKGVDSSDIGSGDGGSDKPAQKASGDSSEKVEETETDAQRAAQVAEAKMKHFCKECGVIMKEAHKCDPEKLDEWANTQRINGTNKEETFTTDSEFMLNDVTGGLNGRKRDQTTLPHTEVSVRDARDATLRDWLKLSGLV